MGLILNRRRVMGGELLPYDAQIEYIQSSGTQYIDTLYYPNNNTRVVCDMQIVDNSQYGRLFGCSSGSEWNSAPTFQVNYEEYVSGGLGATCGNQTTWSRSSSVTGDYNRHNYELSNTSLRRDNVQVLSLSGDTFSCTGSLFIFSLNRGGTVASDIQESSRAKLYSFKIYENEILAHDFIPVRVGSVGYLYDNVSKTFFGNSGSGNFVLGPDIDSELPYDAQIEYLQSSGTLYIDTGIKFKGSSKIEISFMGLATANQAVFGADNGSAYNRGEIALFWNGSVFEPVIPTSNSSSDIPTRPAYAANTVYNISVDKTSLVINGTSYSISMYDSYVCQQNLTLFATNRNPVLTGYMAVMRLYSCKIYDNGTLVRDMIPVKVGTTGYLYDKVSGQLFGNKGTGNFVLSPDLVYHWSGENALSGSSWIDRVSGKIWSVDGNTPTKGTNYYEVGSVPNAFFTMDMNSQGLNLGIYYEIDITFEVLTVGSAEYGNFILDLGSLGPASKAFGISFSNDNRTLSDNWKGLGNNSISYSVGAAGTVPLNQKVTIIYGCKKYNSTQDIQYFINGGATYQSAQPHSPSADFNGTDWGINTGLIGDGVVRSGKCGKIRIYEIKMYRYN